MLEAADMLIRSKYVASGALLLTGVMKKDFMNTVASKYC